jgi:DinB family protein
MARSRKHLKTTKPAARRRKAAAKRTPGIEDSNLRQQLVRVLDWGDAHVDFGKAVGGWPESKRGIKPAGAPHTAWQLVEHMRIGQWDMLEFSRNAKHVSPQWPSGYWPETDGPPSGEAWERSIKAFRADNEAMKKLAASPRTKLFARIPHGTGQTILREVLLTADHNAYHLGQLVLLRRLLGAWPD